MSLPSLLKLCIMKKFLFSAALLVGLSASAQNDLGVSLNSPSANATIGPGLAFTFDVPVTNNGTQAVTSNDTVIYFPTLNGGLLTVTQNGQTVPVAFTITGTTMNTNDTENRAINFAGLNISGASAMSVDFCGGVVAVGPNWRGVTETDTTNNLDCATLSYDPNGGTVGLAENVLFAANSVKVLDGSYSDGKSYFVRVYNMTRPQAKISFVDLTGRTISSQLFNTSDGEVNAELSLNDLPKGVVLAVLEVDGQQVNAKKVIVE